MTQLTRIGLRPGIGGAGSSGGGGGVSPLGAFSMVSLGANLCQGADVPYLNRSSTAIIGLPDSLKDQRLLDINKTTGAVTARTVFTTINQDDHNVTDQGDFPNGTTIVVGCGHNEGNVVNVRLSPTGNLDAFDPATTINFGNPTTYAKLYQDTDVAGRAMVYCRVNQTAWGATITVNSGNSFGTVRLIVSAGSDQMYIKLARIAPSLLGIVAFINPSVGAPTIRIATLNLTTGNLSSGSGVLGNLDGTNLPTDLNDWSILYTAPGTDSPSVLDYDGDRFAMLVARSDQQFYEYYYVEFIGADITNPFAAADWDFGLITAGGAGTGALPPNSAPPYYRTGAFTLSQSPGLTGPQVHLCRMFYGKFKHESWDRIGGTWRPTRYYGQKALGNTDALFRAIALPSDRVPDAVYDGGYSGYNAWDGALYATVISRFATQAPIYSGATNFPTQARKHLSIDIASHFDQPVNFWISGGADAAHVFAFGNTAEFKAHSFTAPADFDANNVYEFTITAYPMVVDINDAIANGLATTVALTITVSAISSSGVSLATYSRNMTNNVGGWTYTGATAPTTTTAEVTDPDGGNAAYKLVRLSGTNANHRCQKTVTITAGNQYMVQSIVHAGIGANGLNFAGPAFFDGTLSYGGIFDLVRRDFVAPRLGDNNTAAIDDFGVEELANDWVRAWILATAQNTSASGTFMTSIKSYGGSRFLETWANTGHIYSYGCMLSLGYSDFVVRTT